MYNNKRNIVVAAERNELNEKFFQSKTEDKTCDMIVIHCNNYENEWYDMIKELDVIINPKGKGKRSAKK